MDVFDFCIVGTGVGGGSLIANLPASSSILVIEEGNDSESKPADYESVGREFGVRTTTSIQLGGTSNLWHGVLAPLDPIDFIKRDYIPNSGWPISFDDLLPYYKKAGNLLNLKDYALFDESHHFVKKNTSSLCFNNSYFKNKIFQQPEPPVNFKTIIKVEQTKRPKLNVMLSTSALSFSVDSDGNVNYLTVGLPNGSTQQVKAKTFIVSAGAIQTPKLLLNSNVKNINIGRYFMDHPMANLTQVAFNFPQKAPIYSDMYSSLKQKIKSGIELNPESLNKLKLPNHNFFLRPSFVKGINDESEKLKLSLLAFKDGKISIKEIFKLLLNINVIKQILTYKLSLNVTYKFADLFFITEQIPNPNSRVMLSETEDRWGYKKSKVDWQLTDSDIEHMKTWFELISDELFDVNKFSFIYDKKDFKWEERYTSAVHHVGTCRMSETPENGVVDKNLKVHGIKNLYVCDGSVFPTSGNVNSSFTISALACRLAQHLSERK